MEARVRELEGNISGLDIDIDLKHMTDAAGVEDLTDTPSAKVLLGEGDQPGLISAVEVLAKKLRDWKVSGMNDVATARAELDAGIRAWKDREQAIEGRVQKILEDLRAKGINPDLREMNRLTAAETKSVRELRSLKSQMKQLDGLQKKRRGLLQQFAAAQTKRFQLRAAATKKLTGQLNEAFDEFQVKLGFREGQLLDTYENWLRESIGKRFVRGPRVNNLCRSISPMELADAVRRADVAKLRALRDDSANPYFADDDEAAAFAETLRARGVIELEQIPVDDQPEISLTADVKGTPTKLEFKNLSFGQKASILLGALLFSSEETPLIIDQPEDHLDSQFISRTVVSVLRRVKERRQVIIATHNANIAVLGDAEQIVPLQGYAGRGHVRDVGSVDATDTRRRTCEILEGGEAAYMRRGEMYGFKMTQ